MEMFCAAGTHTEIGRAVGAGLQAQVKEALRRFRERLIPAIFPNEDYDAVIARFIRDTDMPNTFCKHAGVLMEEIGGIAQTALVSVEELILLNCMDEISSYGVQNKIPEKCTCIGIKNTNDGSVIVAQNMDVGVCFDGLQQLVCYRPEGETAQMMFTIPGLLGLTGVNERGVAVVPNALCALGCDWNGAPVTQIVRGILKSESAAQAAAFVKRISHGAAQNYTIGDPDEIYSFECTRDTKAQFTPSKNAGFDYLVHTNHPLKNKGVVANNTEDTPYSSYKSSLSRLEKADLFLRDMPHAPDVSDIEKLLTNHEHDPYCICKHGMGGIMTFGSVIYELKTPPVMHFAKGPACSNPYETFTFQR